jgi:hypothetical protein
VSACRKQSWRGDIATLGDIATFQSRLSGRRSGDLDSRRRTDSASAAYWRIAVFNKIPAIVEVDEIDIDHVACEFCLVATGAFAIFALNSKPPSDLSI